MNNIKRIRELLPNHSIPAMMITGSASRLHATCFSSSAGALIVSEKDAWFIVDSRYIEAARAAVTDAHVLLVSKNETFPDSINAVLKDNGLSRVGFDDGAVMYATYLQWKDKIEAELIPAQKLVNELRNVKSRNDLDGMINAQRISEKSFEDILPLISTDITEKELAAELVYRMQKNGADDKGFDPIVVSGPRTSLPHGVPTNEKICKGFLTIDFGVRAEGWVSDTTRTLCIGQPDEEMTRVYETVLKAQAAGIGAVRGGISGRDVDAAARKVIEDAGYGECFGHGFGHGIGREVHEPLRASPLSDDDLPAGSMITAEPGVYLPGRYGVRIEDTIYVTEDGCENITKLAKKLLVL